MIVAGRALVLSLGSKSAGGRAIKNIVPHTAGRSRRLPAVGPHASHQNAPVGRGTPQGLPCLTHPSHPPPAAPTLRFAAPDMSADKCTPDKCDKGSVLKWDMKDEPCEGIHCTSEECCHPGE